MAYARWGVEGSKYYIFWYTSDAEEKDNEVLAIWHQDHHGFGPGADFTYADVKMILSSNDFSTIRGVATGDDEFLRPRLEEFIRDIDADYEVPEFASSRLGDPDQVDLYIDALTDPRATIRSKAASALYKLREPRAFEPLLRSLSDENKDVRGRSALALGKLGDMRAYEGLVALLTDESEWVRIYTAIALAELGEQRAIRPLTQLLAKGGPIASGVYEKAIAELRRKTQGHGRDEAAETMP